MSSMTLPELIGPETPRRDPAARSQTVAERSFFAVVEPCDDRRSTALAATVSRWLVGDRPLRRGRGDRLAVVHAAATTSRAAVRRLQRPRSARTRRRHATRCYDLVGEFANMVCGAWLSRCASDATFPLSPPVVEPRAAARRRRSLRLLRRRQRPAARRRRCGSCTSRNTAADARPSDRWLPPSAGPASSSSTIPRSSGRCSPNALQVRAGHGGRRPRGRSVRRARSDPAAQARRAHARHRDAAHGRPDVPAPADGAAAAAGDHRQLGDADRIGREHRGAGGRRRSTSSPSPAGRTRSARSPSS